MAADRSDAPSAPSGAASANASHSPPPATVSPQALIMVVLAAAMAFYLGVRTGRRMDPAPIELAHDAAIGADSSSDSDKPRAPDGTVYRDLFRDLPVRKPEPLKGMDDRIRAALVEWDVPGAAVALVKDDAVVYAKGFGVRKVGSNEPVDAQTLFGIASATKGFTTALAAMLADEGKLNWDDPLARHLPDFELHAPLSARDVTLRDAMCHRTGLPRADEIWAGTNLSRDEVLKKVGTLRPKWPFRSQFGYHNAMYLAAGQAVAHAGGKPWEELVRTRIFEPLGMKSTQATTAVLVEPSGNVASGHDLVQGKVAPTAAKNLDNCAPATAIVSNATDLAQWVRFLLGSGMRDGQALVSPANAYALSDPLIVIPESDNLSKMYPDKTYSAYALGWIVQDYRNRRIVQHPGNANGMRTLIALMPEERLGIVVLANRELSALPMALMYDIFDAYLGKQPTDRVAARTRALKDFSESRPLALKAHELLRSGKPVEALAAFDQSLRKDPLNSMVYHARGAARAATRNFDGAIADYTQAIRLDPHSPKILADRALARINQGDSPSAVADASRALELDPELPEAFNNRALAYKNLNRLDEAAADATRAIELNPKLPGPYAVRGLVRLKQGKDQQAEEDFAACVRINPGMKAPIEREAGEIRASRGK